MPKIPLQDQVFEVSRLEFIYFLRNWISGFKELNFVCIGNHAAALADFNNIYTDMFKDLLRQSKIIETEMDDNEILLPSFDKFLDLTESIWNNEREIIREYAKTVNLDLSIEGNRKKLGQKVKKYRFGDISKGTNVIAPESVIKIGQRSLGLLPDMKKTIADLDAEFEEMLLENN